MLKNSWNKRKCLWMVDRLPVPTEFSNKLNMLDDNILLYSLFRDMGTLQEQCCGIYLRLLKQSWYIDSYQWLVSFLKTTKKNYVSSYIWSRTCVYDSNPKHMLPLFCYLAESFRASRGTCDQKVANAGRFPLSTRKNF